MKRSIVPILLSALLFASCSSPEVKEVRGAVLRTFDKLPANVDFCYTGPSDSTDSYTLEVVGGSLKVSGTSVVAMCKGFHDYIQDNGYGCVTWSGSRLDLPESLPDMDPLTVTSPFKEHLFYNVCAFGYSTPYWGWEQWQKDLDWLAFHGFDMPLAPVGTEAILARVYTKMGLSWDEIAEYFSGPGHFPWMRMGNMCNQDGGMSPEWHDSQIKLEHKILDRMKRLGMQPVFQAFAGFVPEAIEKHFPEVTLTRADWHGLHNQLLNSTDSLFGVIGTAFIREWEAEFGKGKYYLADSFNEMDIPFGERGTEERYQTIKRYSEATFKSIDDANPDAIWVMQGWMFGRDRKRIWDPQSVKALLDGAPDDRLIIIDLAVDFNEFVWRSEKDWDYLDGFSGKKWIWSTTPNFGGRTSLKGVYDFYLNNHLAALSSPNKRELSGFGCSPEGIETNEALYEAISSAGWSSRPKDAREFLAQYFASRYGVCKDEVYPIADGLLCSVYNNFTNSDNFDWVNTPNKILPNLMNFNEGYYDAVRSFLQLSSKCSGNDLYRNDVIYFTSYFLGAKADETYRKSRILLAQGKTEEALALKEDVIDMLSACDCLLENHPLMRIQRWLDYADAMATNPDERIEFRSEALRLTTTWDASGIRDYASRMWSGMLRDYYIPRIEAFYADVLGGTTREPNVLENEYIGRVASEGLSEAHPYADAVSAADSLVKLYSECGYDGILRSDVVGFWFPNTVQSNIIYVYLEREQIIGMHGFEFCSLQGGPVKINKIKVGNIRVSFPDGKPAVIPERGGKYPYSIPADSKLVEGCTPFIIYLEKDSAKGGIIRIY